MTTDVTANPTPDAEDLQSQADADHDNRVEKHLGEAVERFQQTEHCCTDCDKKKLCSICGEMTVYACSDCRIDFSTTIYVCSTKACQDEHETKCSAVVRADRDRLVGELKEAQELATRWHGIADIQHSTILKLEDQRDALKAAQQNLQHKFDGACLEMQEVEQLLGKALGYPWYKDDPKNFPNANEADGVCVGEHTPASIASEAASKLAAQQQAVRLTEIIRVSHNAGLYHVKDGRCEVCEILGITQTASPNQPTPPSTEMEI